jgi:dTDP-4-amino-4,6-dideoxygalactose transaminase
MIRVSEVHLDDQAEALVVQVLHSGHLVQGPMVERFEAAFREITGTAHAVAVNNGTTALVLALEAVGIGPGDEVITTPFTFAATVNAILERGATARLVDIWPDDFTIDVAAAGQAVGPTTRAIMPVHLYGQPADLPALVEITAGSDVALIEDAAQAHGATIGDRAVGSVGVGCFSLYATKNLTTGEGGVVTTDDDSVAARLRVLRNQGMGARYVYEMPGHNFRMTDLHAAIGVAEIQHLPVRTERRRTNATQLTTGLAGIEGLTTPIEQPGRTHVYHQYTVRVGPAARLDRDTLAKELEARGVGSGVYYPRALHEYDCFRGHPRVVVDGSLQEAERAGREVLSLPVHPWLSDGDLDRITTTIHELLD